jgi:hypothetical protein
MRLLRRQLAGDGEALDLHIVLSPVPEQMVPLKGLMIRLRNSSRRIAQARVSGSRT